MANIYRITIESCEASVGDQLNAMVKVDLRTGTSPNFEYTPAQNGHFTVVLDANYVNSALATLSTNVEKRQFLQNLVRQKVTERGISNADEAWIAFGNLFTTDTQKQFLLRD